MLGDRRVAVIADGMDLDAALGELGDIHVARGAGAEKNHVLERVAFIDQIGRQIRMIVDADVVALQYGRQVGKRIGLAIDIDRRIVRARDARPYRRQLVVAVDKERFHEHFQGGTGDER
jgi:hypothetical protein